MALANEISSIASNITESMHGTLHAVYADMGVPSAIWPANMAGARSLPRLMAQSARNARKVLNRALESTAIPRARRLFRSDQRFQVEGSVLTIFSINARIPAPRCALVTQAWHPTTSVNAATTATTPNRTARPAMPDAPAHPSRCAG